MKSEHAPFAVILYICIVFLVLAVVVWYFERKAKGMKRDPYEEPHTESMEEQADRTFFKYIDKLNKDLDRP